jgi:hypothetical protein
MYVIAYTTRTLNRTQSNNNVKITYPSAAVIKQYMIGNGTWQTYSGAIAMTQNASISARSQDSGGVWTFWNKAFLVLYLVTLVVLKSYFGYLRKKRKMGNCFLILQIPHIMEL